MCNLLITVSLYLQPDDFIMNTSGLLRRFSRAGRDESIRCSGYLSGLFSWLMVPGRSLQLAGPPTGGQALQNRKKSYFVREMKIHPVMMQIRWQTCNQCCNWLACPKDCESNGWFSHARLWSLKGVFRPNLWGLSSFPLRYLKPLAFCAGGYSTAF